MQCTGTTQYIAHIHQCTPFIWHAKATVTPVITVHAIYAIPHCDAALVSEAASTQRLSADLYVVCT
jgi:hypothetical protein